MTKGINLNATLAALTILGIIGAGFVFIAPLHTMPAEMKSFSKDMGKMNATLAVQTATLRTVAEIAGDTKTMRRDVDSNSARLSEAIRRLDRLESNP